MDHLGFRYSYASTYTVSVDDLFNVFKDHRYSLLGLQRKANNEIDNWKNDLINQIEQHARQQKYFVDEAFRVREKHLNDMREQFLGTYNICRQKNEAEEIKRLLEKCKNIQVELINSKLLPVTKEFIEITLIEPSEQIDREEPNPKETSGNRFQKRSMGGDGIDPINNKDFTTSSHSTSTAFASDRTNESQTTQSAYDRNQSKDINVNNNPKIDLNDDSSSSDKCPTCFMIFPSYMSEFSRQIHVEDHYKD